MTITEEIGLKRLEGNKRSSLTQDQSQVITQTILCGMILKRPGEIETYLEKSHGSLLDDLHGDNTHI